MLRLVDVIQRLYVAHDAMPLLIEAMDDLRDISAFEICIEQYLAQDIYHLFEAGSGDIVRVVLLRHLVRVEACRRPTQRVGNQLCMMLNEFFGIDVFKITSERGAGSKPLVKSPDKLADDGYAAVFVEKCRQRLRHSDPIKQCR